MYALSPLPTLMDLLGALSQLFLCPVLLNMHWLAQLCSAQFWIDRYTCTLLHGSYCAYAVGCST
jgi:hypothetical protein